MKFGQRIIIYVLSLGLVLYILKVFGIIESPTSLLTSWVFMVFGLTTVLVYIGSERKALLFFSTVIFLLGVVLYISHKYLFLNPKVLFFPSCLFMLGSGFLMLFINETANKIFLYASAVLISFALISIWLTRSFGIMKFINTLSVIIIDYSPLFIILIGIIVLVNRKK